MNYEWTKVNYKWTKNELKIIKSELKINYMNEQWVNYDGTMIKL